MQLAMAKAFKVSRLEIIFGFRFLEMVSAGLLHDLSLKFKQRTLALMDLTDYWQGS